jgi:hypothetical protein
MYESVYMYVLVYVCIYVSAPITYKIRLCHTNGAQPIKASFARIVGAEIIVKPFMIGHFVNKTSLLLKSYPLDDLEDQIIKSRTRGAEIRTRVPGVADSDASRCTSEAK